MSLVLGDGGIGAGALSSREDGGMGPGFHAFVGSGVVPCDGENRRGNQDRLTSHQGSCMAFQGIDGNSMGFNEILMGFKRISM